MQIIEDLLKQPFRSPIEDANQIIPFCGVVYHHQNSLVERNIQSLTLGARILLLDAKQYCSEEIATTLWPYVLKAFAE